MSARVLPYNAAGIAAGAALIRGGEAVAFRTETVYGLGCNAYDAAAVARVFAAKGRPQDNPLIVHLSDPAALGAVAENIPDFARFLADCFMPGPLSLVLPKNDKIPPCVTAGRDTVAVRVPSDGGARAFIAACGVPVAAPSANVSGRPSPTAAAHVLADLGDRIPLILGEGSCPVGLESTVLDCTEYPPRILREGGVTREQIEDALGVSLNKGAVSAAGAPKAPGMKYTHYAPSVPLYLLEFAEAFDLKTVAAKIPFGTRAAVIALNRSIYEGLSGLQVPIIRAGDTAAEGARGLYAALLENEKAYDMLVAVLVPDVGIGRAVNNRLRKAAGGKML
ncbi:MAG: threonylcarbamoyl-AMP synthase [Clostridiales bacterium]|jgi:L-threonylcarbamoyladenylate synthase|nr:threonylcarbamoyl-AMP synthase [Clostridiales bacterium]